MENFAFTSNDYDVLKRLLQVTKDIKLVYDELYILESNNKKNNEKYNQLLNLLNNYIKIEDELYSLIGTNMERMYLFMDYLFPNGCNEFEEEIEIIKNDDENAILRGRIASKISELIASYSFDDELEEDISMDNFEEMDYDREYKECALIELSVQKDILNTILVMLENYIKNNKYDFMLDKMVKLKYNLIFMYKNIESDIVKNNYDINLKLYLQSIILTEAFGRDKDDTLSILSDYIDNLYILELSELRYLIREEKDSKFRKEQLILTIILIRTFIIYKGNTDIKMLKNTLDLELLLNMSNTNLVENLINEMFEENPKDKEIPQILSLRP